MLKPREADIPALFVVLVVLPLVTYILLGKWNEAAKKKARISVLAQLAAEETCRIEAMATADVMPAVSFTKTLIHLCARCYGPATTRCSRCKTVRYCSGKCQIIHWRQGHKQECQQMDGTNSSPYANLDSVANAVHQEVLLNENTKSPFLRSHHVDEPMPDSNCPDTSFQPPIMVAAMFATPSSATETPQISTTERKLSDNKRVSQKFDCEMMMSSEAASCNSFKETNSSGVATSILMKKKVLVSKAVPVGNGSSSSDEIPMKQNNNGSPVSVHGHTISNPRNVMYPPYKLKTKSGSSFESNSISGISASLHPGKSRINAYEIITNVTATMDKEIPQKMACSTIPAQHSNGISTLGDVKNVGLKKLSKILRRDAAGRTSNSLKKIQVLFPYEEFVKLFHYEVWDLFPRGLLNCGNSCYANAVLQCLTCTKPLISYLLQRAHSRACWVSGWCLMCELEQHVSMLREGRGPLSPSTILSHMQNTGTQMGGGDQEDAHEFLRLLVTSMQSICLEGLGGEKEIDIMLQETTLIQQIFGGRLRSKVKCLRCHHESERYENIMDLTLEILGWVESLEDALTQFTSPEDLDGENMYRCGRCKAYVKARKQLSVHEAPNILTIVLKRFQTGKYGKINKCITFPDMLDMIPFMTGTSDSPPLYMLYGVVVHLDTLNASFSGHYVSYVKDLQGTWFRIDDTEVEPVPMSQVMSEGAYILFYSRSYPRPPRDYTGRPPLQAPPYSKRCTTKAQKSSSRYGQSKQNDVLVASEQSPVHAANMGNYLREETSTGISYGTIDHSTRTGRNVLPTRQTYSMDFSDTTSSDWSLFTSSDESSFTTESTRDSFSTVDYGDLHNMDPVFTIFNPYSVPEYSNSNVSCTKFSPCKPQTRFFLESSGLVLDSSMSTEQFDKCT